MSVIFGGVLRRRGLEALLEGCGIADGNTRKRIADAVNKHIMEGFLMKAKSGWKTTEFWLSLLATVGATGASLVGALPPKAAAIVGAVSAAAYSISRGLAKVAMPPAMEPPSEP